MVKPTLLSRLAFYASFFAFSVIALGAFTRLIDAGLGCPDWPGCYGHITVPLSGQGQSLLTLHYPETPLVIYKAWAEMIHRYFVGGLSVFIMGIVILIFKKEFRTRSNIILAASLILLLAYQIILGRWTVTLKLLPIIVTQHLLGGFLILAVLWLIYLINRVDYHRDRLGSLSVLYYLSIFSLILLLLQISLGAWTSTHYASLSCPDFPFCINDELGMTFYFKEAFNFSLFKNITGHILPTQINYEGGVLPIAVRQTIHMVHRLGALILTVYFFVFTAFAMQKLKESPELMKGLYLILGLLIIQLCVGIANVIFKLPLVTALGHNLIAALLLLAVITFIFKLRVSTS